MNTKLKFSMLLLALILMVMAPTGVQAATSGAIVAEQAKTVTANYNNTKQEFKKENTKLHLKKKLSLYSTPDCSTKVATAKAKKPLQKIAKGQGYTIVKKGKQYYFAKNNEIKTLPKKKTWKQFKRRGVLRYYGHKWTWYSTKEYAGRGLKIPGRYVDKETRCVCDKDGYICLAASRRYKKGTVFKTPLGKWGKVYDRGVRGKKLDVYTTF